MANTISTTTRRVGFSPTTCPAEIKIEATTNENKGLLYSSILGSSSVSGSFEHMSGCHLFRRPPIFGAHLFWRSLGKIFVSSYQHFCRASIVATCTHCHRLEGSEALKATAPIKAHTGPARRSLRILPGSLTGKKTECISPGQGRELAVPNF